MMTAFIQRRICVFFQKELAHKFGCALNEYLYYFFYPEKAVQNILEAGVTRGEVIRDVNRHMTEELSRLDPGKDFDACIETYVKWHGKRSAMYMKNETKVCRPEPFTFDLFSRDDGGMQVWRSSLSGHSRQESRQK